MSSGVTVEDVNEADEVEIEPAPAFNPSEDVPSTEQVQNERTDVKKSEKGVKMVMGSLEDVMAMANIIFKDVKDVEEHKNKNPDEKLKYFQDKYADFGKTFPIVLKHMVNSGYFYKDVFEKFIKLSQAKPTHSMDEFQTRQADYLTMIYRKEHKHCGGKEAAKVHNMYYTQLKNEEKHMKRVMDSVKEDRSKKQNKYNDIKRSEILNLINKYLPQIPDDIQINLSGQDRKYESLPTDINTNAPLPIVNQLTEEDVSGKFGKITVADSTESATIDPTSSIIEANKEILNEEDDSIKQV